jgi:hypothetical protein
MRKEIYLIRGNSGESYSEFSTRIISLAKNISKASEVVKVKLSYTEIAPPKLSVIPFKKNKIAVISAFTQVEGISEKLIMENGFSGIYLVDEAIPVAYDKHWNDLEKTPGVCLLTLFKKKKTLDYETFLTRWHNGHTPLSLKIHPLWNYNRNVVTKKLNESSFPWDGIVEEHFRSTSDLLNPIKFFGNPLVMIYNMARVYFDTNSFLDYKTIEPYFATEIHIKS